MSGSVWHLIGFDERIGSTYIMDVPGGALYMVKPGKFLVRVSRWQDFPPQITFVPGASVAMAQEKSESANGNPLTVAKAIKLAKGPLMNMAAENNDEVSPLLAKMKGADD